MAAKMKATRVDQGNSITQPVVTTTFDIKGPILEMINSKCQFSGKPSEDANEHIRIFKGICGLFKILDILDEVVYLRLFPWTLTGEASAWLNGLPEGTIDTWNMLQEKFLGKYFPASKAARLQQELTQFRQHPNETLYDSWSRFSRMLRACPQHGLDTFHKVQIFYKGCNVPTRVKIDQAAGGSHMDKTEQEAYEVIEKQAEYSHEWHQENDFTHPTSTVASAGAYDNIGLISAKLDGISRNIEKINKEIHAIKVGCEYCGGPHLGKDCDAGLTMDQKEQVAYLTQQNNNQFQGRAQFNRNFNNSYNSQGRGQNANFGGSSGFFQQRALGYYEKPDVEEKKSSLESMIETLVASQTQLVISNLERQISSLAGTINDKKQGELPRDAKINLRGENLNVIVSSSEEKSGDEKSSLKVKEVKDVPPVVKNEKPVVKPYRPPIPFPRKGVEYEVVERPSNLNNVCFDSSFSGTSKMQKEIRKEARKEKRREEHEANIKAKQELKAARAVPIKVEHPVFPPKLGDPGFPDLSPTTISISLYDQAKKHPVGMAEDVHVRIGDMNFLANFVVMDVEEHRCPSYFRESFSFYRPNVIKEADEWLMSKADVDDIGVGSWKLSDDGTYDPGAG
ncbi:uncharacterized protein [Rutidosis leptorrhynchoides]|uniref:uncharacterized protein n=1 Tax=Rutidosis leptorrhynchoides TaxID=125765 RepID=UPI003A9A0E22